MIEQIEQDVRDLERHRDDVLVQGRSVAPAHLSHDLEWEGRDEHGDPIIATIVSR